MTDTILLDKDIGHDATDCQAAYDAGDLTFLGGDVPTISISDGVDFGDDASMWANDGECDDPRFSGPGMTSTTLLDEDAGHDATDCRTAYEAGNLAFDGGSGSSAFGGSTFVDGIDFGDDDGSWANNGECDDPRFEGPGAADILVDADIRHDATDCRTAYEAGELTFLGEGGATDIDMGDGDVGGVDFGDDASMWANDGECDDPRFSGPGMTSTTLLDEDAGHDATDCRTAYEAGDLTFGGDSGSSDLGGSSVVDGIDFGDDDGSWANDGECDDPRFQGPGMTSTALLDDDIRHDATDCRTAYEAGDLTLIGDAEVSEGDVVFGDDESTWANDGECDDPRFEGPGMTSTTLLDTDIGHDASDCRAAYEAGELTLKSD